MINLRLYYVGKFINIDIPKLYGIPKYLVCAGIMLLV